MLAAVVVVGASVGVTLLAAGSKPAPPAVTVTSVATVPVSSEVSTVVRRTETITSIAAVTASAHVCTDGSTGTGACSPYTCWDGSKQSVEPCPALTGAKALQWIYPAHGTPARTCVPMTAAQLGSAVEGIVCSWSDLDKITTQLVRWPSAAAAKAFGDESFGTSQPTAGSKGISLGIEWDLTSVDHDKRWIYDVIPGQPYSFQMSYAGSDGHQDPQITTWYGRQSYAYPAEIDEAQNSAG